MRFKRSGSLLFLIVGIFLILWGARTPRTTEQPRDFAQKTSDFFHSPMWNPIIEFFGGTPIKEPSKHNVSSVTCIVIGSFLIVFGGVFAWACRKKD